MQYEATSSLTKVGVRAKQDVNHCGVDEPRLHQRDDQTRTLPGVIDQCIRETGLAGDVMLATKPEHNHVAASLGLDYSCLEHRFLHPPGAMA